MPELHERLAALRERDTRKTDDVTVAADLARCRTAAVRRRRRRRSCVAGAAAVSIAAAGALTYVATDDPATSGRTQRAESRPDPGSSTPAASRTSAGPTPPARPALRLVAYEGKQLPGYTVERIPAGYVLQGISSSVLVISERGDHSPLDVFERKLVVMLNDYPAPTDGQRVSVHGTPGYVRTDTGIRTLAYRDGKFNVAVQAWSNIAISPSQLVRFAEGVTILPNVQVGSG